MKALTPEEMAKALFSNINMDNITETDRDNTEINGLDSEQLKMLYPELVNIFQGSIRQSLMDIKMGANSDEFYQLTLLNFITRCVVSGYGFSDIEEFLHAYLGETPDAL